MAAARARLAVTLGDPRGIGAEIVRKALTDPRVRDAVEPTIVGPAGTEVNADMVVGTWTPGGSGAEAGRLAGLAIEREIGRASCRERV